MVAHHVAFGFTLLKGVHMHLSRLIPFMALSLVAFFSVANRPAWAADPQGGDDLSMPELRLSLREAMDATVGNNPTVKVLKERIEAARAVAATQLGALLPNISSSVRQSRQNFFQGTIGLAPVVTPPFSIFDTRANMTQNLFSMSLIHRWKSSREALKVAELESETGQFDSMAEAALRYVEALRAEEILKARDANVKLFEELTNLARNRRGGGMGTGLDTARAEAQLENERQQLALAKGEAERTKLVLLHAMGIPFNVRLVLTDNLKAEVSDAPGLEEALKAALASRVELLAQLKRIKSSSLALDSTVYERLPSLILQGDYGLIGNRMTNTADTYTVAGLLSVPIFDGGQREGRISESRSLAKQELYKLVVIQNQVALDVREALVTLESARDQVSIAKRGLQSAVSEQEIARERFTILTSQSNLELTNALFSLARARDNAVDALFRLNATRVHLARATGKLAELH